MKIGDLVILRAQGEVCDCCGGGEIRVNFLGAQGEVIKSYNQWLG